MKKELRKISNLIKINDDKLNHALHKFNLIKKELGINKKFKIVGSFHKDLMTTKTKDIDIDIIIPSNCNVNFEIKRIKKIIITNFQGKHSIKNGNVSLEITIDDFIFSFTFIQKSDGVWKKIIFKQNSFNIEKVILKMDKDTFNSKLETVSKNQRWIAKKFVLIMIYLLECSRHNLPKFQLESILINELLSDEYSNIEKKFQIFKNFFQKLSNGSYDDMLINLINKNASGYKSLKGRAKRIYKRIENLEMINFYELFFKRLY